jgi:hypothetical protein
MTAYYVQEENALALASFGVATLSQSVVERTREIGIRVAVGALPRQVSALVLREGVALSVAGIVLGSAVATLAGGHLLFSLVSAIAVYVPAWRAARLDPTVASTAVAVLQLCLACPSARSYSGRNRVAASSRREVHDDHTPSSLLERPGEL